MGHTDVVPVNADGWSRDPFGGEVVDGFVWGRGAVDMLNLTASQAVAFRRLADSGFRPKGTLIYLAVADEEALGTWGAHWLLDHERDAVYADYVLTESGGFQMPDARRARASRCSSARRARTGRRSACAARPGHGSQPFRTDNALVTAAEVVRRIAEYRPQAQIHDVVAPVRRGHGLRRRAHRARCSTPTQFDDALRRAAARHRAPLCTRARTPRSRPTVAHGGTKTNVIPDQVELEVDIRTLPGQTRRGRGRDCCARRSATSPTRSRSSRTTTARPRRRSTRRCGTRWPARAARLCEGSALVPSLMVGGTDNRFYRRAGAVGYGFGLFSQRLAVRGLRHHVPRQRRAGRPGVARAVDAALGSRRPRPRRLSCGVSAVGGEPRPRAFVEREAPGPAHTRNSMPTSIAGADPEVEAAAVDAPGGGDRADQVARRAASAASRVSRPTTSSSAARPARACRRGRSRPRAPGCRSGRSRRPPACGRRTCRVEKLTNSAPVTTRTTVVAHAAAPWSRGASDPRRPVVHGLAALLAEELLDLAGELVGVGPRRSSDARRAPRPARSASSASTRQLELAHVALRSRRCPSMRVVDLGAPHVDELGRARARSSGRSARRRSARAARAWRAGSAGSARSGAPAPTATPSASPASRHASCSTPTMPVGPSYCERDEPERRERARGRSTVPVTRTGRGVRDVAEQRAERDDRVAARLARDVDDRRRSTPPAQVGLDAAHDDDVALRRRTSRSTSWRGHVHRRRATPSDELDVRAARLVVDVLVGVDRRERRGAVSRVPHEPVGGAGGGVAGVVPALEGGDEHGVAQLGPSFPVQAVGHRREPTRLAHGANRRRCRGAGPRRRRQARGMGVRGRTWSGDAGARGATGVPLPLG